MGLREPEGPIGGGLNTRAVIFDFSNGSPEEKLRWETDYGYGDMSGSIAESMTSWSGIEFFFTVSSNSGGATVIDWQNESSLILGYPPEDQKTRLSYAGEEHTADFIFNDADTLRWFMMDSAWRNFGGGDGKEIFFTMDGGKELAFDELYPVNIFPADMPYMGSAFYFAHADNIGG